MATVIQTSGVCFSDVYEVEDYLHILYDLLKEREAYESISHEEMPTFFQHQTFVATHPYRHWYFIFDPNSGIFNDYIGTIAVTRQNEIAIAIFKKHRRKGWGKKAIEAMLNLYPHIDFLANINPANQKSIDLFSGLGFKHIQNTYKLKRST
jgi:RimJ/RimL family protein N-acetyltransferase